MDIKGIQVRCIRYVLLAEESFKARAAETFRPENAKKKKKLIPCHTEPSTATKLGQVTNSDLEDFKRAIESADKAQPSYFEETTATSRGALLRKWYDLMIANKEDRT
jgi:acyl-CoA reductase-like NAD-dependent aldehyde dehydrogenase